LEPSRVVVCVLVAGEQWSYRTHAEMVSELTTSDKDVCKAEFPLDPGQEHSWTARVRARDITSGTLKLELNIMLNPRHGRPGPEPTAIHLASPMIPIEIVNAE
jgi:hypothetical protein